MDFYPNKASVHPVDGPTGWRIRGHEFIWGRKTYVMGILNVTPDSFSDGGEFASIVAAVNQAQTLANAGVDILDVGGQSTRPGAEEICRESELERVIPVINAIRQELNTPISIDTTRAEVAQSALNAGADLINDVSGGKDDPQIFEVAARSNVPIVLMHRRGTPQTMQSLTDYGDLIGELLAFFQAQITTAMNLGIPQHHIVVDPGIGFAKTTTQNIHLLQNLRQFQTLGCPILIGTSRKRFIGEILNQPNPKARIWGTAATCCYAIAQGVDLVRVHDGLEMVQTCRMADRLWRQSS